MRARILIVEDEEPLTMLLRYNFEAEGYEVETAARGDEADTPPEGNDARSGGARLDDARPVRDRALPPPARAAGNLPSADHHAHRARRGERKGAGIGDWRGRLHLSLIHI